MGKIAEDMIRLSAEIREQRAERVAYIKALKEDVVRLRRDFRQENISRARASRIERQEVLKDLAAARRAWFGSGMGGGQLEMADAEIQELASEVEKARRTTGMRRSSSRAKNRGEGQTGAETPTQELSQ